MIENQVLMVLDDHNGNGLKLTNRFLLEDSIVILLTNEEEYASAQWHEEIEQGRLLLLPIENENETGNAIASLSPKYQKIDALIICTTMPKEFTDVQGLTVKTQKILNCASRFLKKTQGASLLFVQYQQETLSEHAEKYVNQLSDQVSQDANQFIRDGVRHNLLIHESPNEETEDPFSSSALFLTSDLSKYVYGQVLRVRE